MKEVFNITKDGKHWLNQFCPKMKYKTNKDLEFIKDRQRSYVFVKEKGKDVGIFCWSYAEKKWIFVRNAEIINDERKNKRHGEN